jgi:hypothetical protein
MRNHTLHLNHYPFTCDEIDFVYNGTPHNFVAPHPVAFIRNREKRHVLIQQPAAVMRAGVYQL